MNHDSHIVGMIQSLEMTAEQHNGLPLVCLPCGLNVFCTEGSVRGLPSYFLSL